MYHESACLKKKKKNQYWICRGMKFTVNTWSSKLNMLFFLQCNYLSVGDLMLNGIFSLNLACKVVFTLRTWPAPNKLWVRWSVLGRVTADRTIRTLPPRKEIITISLVWSHTPASTSNSIPPWWSLTHRKSSLVTNWKNSEWSSGVSTSVADVTDMLASAKMYATFSGGLFRNCETPKIQLTLNSTPRFLTSNPAADTPAHTHRDSLTW